jgi:hypothetical protein
MIWRLGLLFFLFTVGAAACSAESLVSVQITPSKSDVKLGQDIVIRVRATNTSQTSVMVGEPPMFMEIYMENANGDPVQRTRSARISASSGLINRVLVPGETQETTEKMNDYFKIEKPGTYLIRVKYGYALSPSSPLASQPMSNPAALSNLIRVTVTN